MLKNPEVPLRSTELISISELFAFPAVVTPPRRGECTGKLAVEAAQRPNGRPISSRPQFLRKCDWLAQYLMRTTSLNYLKSPEHLGLC